MLFALPFIGCSKDDALNGTTWVTTQKVEGTNVTVTLKFTSKKDFTLSESAQGQSLSISGTYTYDGSAEKGTLTATVGGETDTIEFTVDGKKLTLKGEDMNLTLTKQ